MRENHEYLYKGRITKINDEVASCFHTNTYGKDHNTVDVHRCLFLPLNKVKEDKQVEKETDLIDVTLSNGEMYLICQALEYYKCELRSNQINFFTTM